MSRKRITDELLEDVAYGKAHLSDYSERMLASELMDLRTRIAALESQLAWIPVSERLPEVSGRYNTRISQPSVNGLPHSTYEHYGYDDYDVILGWFNSLPYTHWRPLPEPPHESRIQEAQG
jgi:hypothetical protein